MPGPNDTGSTGTTVASSGPSGSIAETTGEPGGENPCTTGKCRVEPLSLAWHIILASVQPIAARYIHVLFLSIVTSDAPEFKDFKHWFLGDLEEDRREKVLNELLGVTKDYVHKVVQGDTIHIGESLDKAIQANLSGLPLIDAAIEGTATSAFNASIDLDSLLRHILDIIEHYALQYAKEIKDKYWKHYEYLQKSSGATTDNSAGTSGKHVNRHGHHGNRHHSQHQNRLGFLKVLNSVKDYVKGRLTAVINKFGGTSGNSAASTNVTPGVQRPGGKPLRGNRHGNDHHGNRHNKEHVNRHGNHENRHHSQHQNRNHGDHHESRHDQHHENRHQGQHHESRDGEHHQNRHHGEHHESRHGEHHQNRHHGEHHESRHGQHHENRHHGQHHESRHGGHHENRHYKEHHDTRHGHQNRHHEGKKEHGEARHL